VISVPPGGRVAVPTSGENRAPPPGFASETNNDCQVKFELIHLWLLIEPRTIFEGITDDNKAAAADFARERAVRRYNRQLNDLIAFWAMLLTDDGGELRALDIGAGVDAAFRLSPDTAFSRRAQV
jgi:hypothetical protein